MADCCSADLEVGTGSVPRASRPCSGMAETAMARRCRAAAGRHPALLPKSHILSLTM
jgi:hypothetical protein